MSLYILIKPFQRHDWQNISTISVYHHTRVLHSPTQFSSKRDATVAEQGFVLFGFAALRTNKQYGTMHWRWWNSWSTILVDKIVVVVVITSVGSTTNGCSNTSTNWHHAVAGRNRCVIGGTNTVGNAFDDRRADCARHSVCGHICSGAIVGARAVVSSNDGGRPITFAAGGCYIFFGHHIDAVHLSDCLLSDATLWQYAFGFHIAVGHSDDVHSAGHTNHANGLCLYAMVGAGVANCPDHARFLVGWQRCYGRQR